MPKLKPEVQRARREHILDAAERCFARAGFHRTTMHDICKEAGVSPGALYVYFDSKEALIAGICERDRAEFAERFDRARRGARTSCRRCASWASSISSRSRPQDHRMCVEIGLESTRNPRIGEIHQRIDRYILESFQKLFQQHEGRGPHRARRSTSRPWRGRSWWSATACSGAAPSIPSFDPKAVMPAVLQLMPHAAQSRAEPMPAPGYQHPTTTTRPAQ